MNNLVNLHGANADQLSAAPRSVKAKKQAMTLSYRLMILYRFALALFGGYLLASLSAMLIAACFVTDRINAVMAATLLAFVIHCAVFIWVFMVNKTLKASLGVLLPAAILYGLLMWVAQ